MDYTKKAKKVAKELIGKTIYVNNLESEIVETEAYEGGEPTKNRYCMNFSPGKIGILSFRGLDFLNIGTEKAGKPSCVLIRAIKIGDEVIDGPGRVGKALNAKKLEYLTLGVNLEVSGETKPSKFYKVDGASENSLGRYRVK